MVQTQPAAIAIVGTLDTKGEAIEFLRDRIQERGCKTLVVDVGLLGRPGIEADIPREAVARCGGVELDALLAGGDKVRAINVMTAGAAVSLARLYATGAIGAGIAVGGGQGAAIGSAALRALPLGAPKLLVSTIASGRNVFEPYVGTSDMTLMHSVSDILGVDAISRTVLTNAAGAISGMMERKPQLPASAQTVLGATMLGLTTDCVMAVRKLLQGKGYDVVPFHANGTGGRCLEELVERGVIRGVLDISVQELIGNLCGGLFDAGPDRLVAAGRAGIPQVVVPGGSDYIVFGPLANLDDKLRSRPLVRHNPNITLVRTSTDEMGRLGRVIAERINAAVGPTIVLVPLRGFSQSDVHGGAFFDTEADGALIDALHHGVRPGIDVIEVDDHINSPGFSQVVVNAMCELMAA